MLIVLGGVSGGTWQWSYDNGTAVAAGAGGLLFFGPLLMIVFRQKYPRWWFDWNRELHRFGNRVIAYLALMNDRYPATDDHQSVHLDYSYPDVPRELNRWFPLVKWFLAIPHYVVLVFLDIAAVAAVIIAWFAVLFTGRCPRRIFDFVEGVIRWHNRVLAYRRELLAHLRQCAALRAGRRDGSTRTARRRPSPRRRLVRLVKAKNEYAPALAAAATWCRPVTLANGGPPEPVRRSGVPDVESVSLTVQRSPAMCFSGSGPAAAPAWSTEQAAIVGRGPIEQAKGLLAERYQITPDAARDL